MDLACNRLLFRVAFHFVSDLGLVTNFFSKDIIVSIDENPVLVIGCRLQEGFLWVISYQLRVIGYKRVLLNENLLTDSFNHQLASVINVKARVDG